MISLSSNAILSLSIETCPSASVWTIRTYVAPSIVVDFSLWAKSPSDIVATWDWDFEDQAPIECGFFLA